MNNIPPTRYRSKLKSLSDTVGDFISYWGFRRIHGQIWTQVYLSPQPLSGTDLVERLGVSKALVSPALHELVSHGLLFHCGGDGKTKLYQCHQDFWKVIVDILKKREVKLIHQTQTHALELLNLIPNNSTEIDSQRLRSLLSLTQLAASTIDNLTASKKPGSLALLGLLTKTRSLERKSR